jgi:cyclomaltodextrinase / maltogenic alpha-amylase / neopullulanase
MTVPAWVQDSIFYQIFPDRFCNGKPGNDPANVLPWDAAPTGNGFHGGDLQGIIDRMYYLIDLGINAIYLNPIFLSPSNHRYNIVDYYQVDPKLGTQAELLTLLDVAHRNNIKIILDGVFNHCGRGFFAFNDILENQSYSAYTNWFHVHKFPIEAYSPGDATTYTGWWKHKSLPKFNTNEPAVRKYIFDIARYWIEQGFDGWRLDVPNEIDDDPFWYEFRRIVKNVNKDAYLLGEIWDGNPRWVGERHFDGLMNYPFRTMIIDLLLQKQSPTDFSAGIERWLKKYPLENVFAQYNLLGSHDTERVFTLMKGDVEKLKLAFLIQFTYPGTPALYYGDEVGISGGSDPDCRKTFPWNEELWNTSLRQWVRKLIWLRREKAALRRGELNFIDCGNQACLAYCRKDQNDLVLICINPTEKRQTIRMKIGEIGIDTIKGVKSVFNQERISTNDGTLSLTLEPWTGNAYLENE